MCMYVYIYIYIYIYIYTHTYSGALGCLPTSLLPYALSRVGSRVV